MLQRVFEDAGELTMLLTHAAAHIVVNPRDLGNDMDPAFQTEFHRLLRVCGQMAFSAAAGSAVAPGASHGPGGVGVVVV